MVKLQGTAPNQVPTNADLGSLAYVDHDNVNLTAADLRLKALSKTKSQTAVDVFVYDTSKDSDGGAWRHRTQHTSWYNEGASSTRGSRKEFPSVAVIVAEAAKVTIYDGDDPSLPMWMVFNAGSGNALYINASSSPTAARMLNGELFVGLRNGAASAGLNNMSFVADTTSLRITTTVQYNVMTIAERNRGGTTTIDGSFTAGIVNRDVNDVAMTVLPNAPTDPATGLPVPTIAVATDGGVSVIRDDGTVVDITQFGYASDFVAFTEDNRVLIQHTVGAAEAYYRVPLPTSDVTTNLAADGFAIQERAWSASHQVGTIANTANIVANGNGMFLGEAAGLHTFNEYAVPKLDGGEEDANALHAITTSSYNTGWMNGDIKLAALADTTAGTLSGNTFSSNFDNFTLDGFTDASVGTGTADASSGDLVLSRSDVSNYGIVVRTLSGLVIGETYKVQATFGGAKTRLGYIQISSPLTGMTDYNAAKIEFTANSTSAELQINPGAAGSGDLTVSEVIFGRTDPDRSVNNNGLIVNGSITKAPVATGADVVAYSGFSSSNYLEQPYNADLNFGTDDFCVMGWVKTSATGIDYVVQRANSSASDGFFVWVDGNGNLNFATRSGTTSFITGATDVTTNNWQHFAAVRTNLGADLAIYLNGEIDAAGTVTPRAVTGTDQQLYVGIRADQQNPFAGSLALIRVSGTAPTADQIKKIYEDEKFLFQKGAKATLYGTSDAVTALAHDPVTDLLHVGTSSGRSVFQGLRRVEESTGTDSQSLAAISAVDGLVVEGK